MRGIKFRVWLKRGKRMLYDSGLSIQGTKVVQEKETEVMQFTGLKDKNGKEIYEGDVIKWVFDGRYKREFLCEVKYEGSSFLLIRIDKVSEEDKLVGALDEFPKNCKVIGNIYENPELLKQESEK